LFYELFDIYPNIAIIYFNPDMDEFQVFDWHYFEEHNEYKSRNFSVANLRTYLYQTSEYTFDYNSELIYVFSNCIIIIGSIITSANKIYIYYKDSLNDIATNIIDNLKKPDGEKQCRYRYVYVNPDGGFSHYSFKLQSNYDVDLKANYNDDLPFDELVKFVEQQSCGLSLLYGNPGTGKTTLIKNLINRCDKDFYFLDCSLLGNITNSQFINYIYTISDSVFVLEDCEKLLVSRDNAMNPWIGTLLNLTDGILGESLAIKFICTFNTDIRNIDKALLREGRLSVCYEFKPLSSDKVYALCGKSTPMTLAQIYKKKLDTSSTKTNKIGF
jgi:hypothetical protein